MLVHATAHRALFEHELLRFKANYDARTDPCIVPWEDEAAVHMQQTYKALGWDEKFAGVSNGFEGPSLKDCHAHLKRKPGKEDEIKRLTAAAKLAVDVAGADVQMGCAAGSATEPGLLTCLVQVLRFHVLRFHVLR